MTISEILDAIKALPDNIADEELFVFLEHTDQVAEISYIELGQDDEGAPFVAAQLCSTRPIGD